MACNFDSVCRGFRVVTQGMEAISYNTRRDVSGFTKVWITALAVADIALWFNAFREQKQILKWVVLVGRFVVATSTAGRSSDFACTSIAQWMVLSKVALKFSVNHFDIRKVNEPRIQDALTGAEMLLRTLFWLSDSSSSRARRHRRNDSEEL